MNILRSILAVVAGWVVSVVVMISVETANFVVYAPADGKSFTERMEEMKDKEVMKAFIESLPTGGLVIVLVAWQAGAFIGGVVSALIACRWRLLHAGIVGAFVLAGTILNVPYMKREYGFSHPDWMLVVGLLLPLPSALVAGKLVTLLCRPPQAEPPPASIT